MPGGGTNRTAAASNVRYLVKFAVASGLEREEVLERFAIDPAVLAAIDGRIPLVTVARIWNELPEWIGDPQMPLHALHYAEFSDPPLGMLLFVSAPTLGAALQRMVRYERLNFDLADEPLTCLLAEGEQTAISIAHEHSAVTPPTGAVIDSFLGLTLMARLATGADITPIEIALRHPRPERPELYVEALRCPITFGAERDRLVLATQDLLRPIPNASRTLAAIVERDAAQQLAAMPVGSDLLWTVRQTIRQGLPDGAIGLDEVAGRVDLAPRTLQRRLEREGTSLRELIDCERRELALHHIAKPRTTLVEIACLLGFADQSSFTRAFTRWTSHAPGEYRRLRS